MLLVIRETVTRYKLVLNSDRPFVNLFLSVVYFKNYYIAFFNIFFFLFPRIDKFLEGLTSDGADLPVNNDNQIDNNIIDEIKTADLVRIFDYVHKYIHIKTIE